MSSQEHHASRIRVKDLLGPIRLPFLLLPPVCVFLGMGTAYWSTSRINWWYALLALIGAISSHISVNTFNEYLDFRSGLDTLTDRTPFSGGSGILPAHPELAGLVLVMAWISLMVPVLIGAYFLAVWGPAILPLGIAGLVVVLSYTRWITRIPLLCLVTPGLGFGILWVTGTDFVLTGRYSFTAFTASLIPFFLVNDLLLLNQFPDAEADRSVGRRHLPILIGKKTSSHVYTAFLALAYLSIILGVALRLLPKWSMLGLLTISLAIPAAHRAMRYAEETDKLMPALVMNVLINLLTPLCMALGLFMDRKLG